MNKHTASDEATKLAHFLLKYEAVKLSPELPFTWASGWKSPIYCDNRKLLGFPEARDFVVKSMLQKITATFPMCEALAGVATAGIPWASFLAQEMNVPLLYVRSAPKSHGLTNLIEGNIVEGQQVVVIEDLVSTGGSSLKAVEALQNAGLEVLGMAAVFTYGFPVAQKQFERANIPLLTISDYNNLVKYAVENNMIAPEWLETLNNWKNTPDTWGITA